MSRSFRRRRATIAASVLAGSLSIAACSSESASSTSTTAAAPTTAVETSTTAPATTSTTTSTTVPATTTSTSVAPPATSEPPATTAPEAVTTTTEPLAVQELLLRGDGIGSAVFGADPDGVIDYVTSIIGGNTADTGWVDPFTFALCDGTVARRVDWGVLSLLFGDLSDVASGRRHFLGWEYGRAATIGDEPVGLRTPGGTTLGTRVVDLRADFEEVRVNEGEDELGIPPNFYVSDNFRGLLTGTTDGDVVTVMFGGYGCGE